MNKYALFVFVAIFVSASVAHLKTYLEGIYWRDFEGIIPEDALVGGQDKNGRPIYIGQVLFENRLIPGKIYENDKNIYFFFNWETPTSTDENVKILCTEHPENFEWILTKPSKVTTLTNKSLVKGGYETGYFTYIGRIYSGLETSVGKVICTVNDCLGLYIIKDEKRIKHTGEFEILTYNPNNTVTTNDKFCVEW